MSLRHKPSRVSQTRESALRMMPLEGTEPSCHGRCLEAWAAVLWKGAEGTFWAVAMSIVSGWWLVSVPAYQSPWGTYPLPSLDYTRDYTAIKCCSYKTGSCEFNIEPVAT